MSTTATRLLGEIGRLTVALHARQAHPDYEYCVNYGDRAVSPAHRGEIGWVENYHVPDHGNGASRPRAWYWRRIR